MIHRNRRRATALLAAASSLAFAGPAWAADVLFRTQGGADVEVGQRVEQATGLTQIRLDSGAIVSFLDTAAYRIDADGSVELFSGSVTVAGAPTGTTVIRMPEGVEGRVGGTGSAASFSVAADGSSNGHVMSGLVQIVRGGNPREFRRGEMWQWARQGGLRLVVANGPQATPDADVALADMSEGGPAAAAENGVPVTLGDALAAAGASGDVITAARRVEAAVGNPGLASFPSGDLALLVDYAAQLDGLHGGRPFPGAGADIIRTYLGHLAAGGSGANFLTAYAGFMAQYLDLLRTGALPSSFQAASPPDINSFIAYLGQASGFGSLSPANRTLVEAYLAFLQGGGNPDLFAGNYTNLVNAYFAYLRTGGDPAAFTGATQATLNAYIAFLGDSGLLAQLSAANRALLQAYLANGGFAFAAQYRTALDAYFAYLAAGNLPSGYGTIDAVTLRAYLETLQAAGLFDQVLGARAEFYSGYLAYLQAGGTIDGYAGLNANVFAGYAGQLNAFFAFIQAGGLPQGYDGDVEALFAYLAVLEEAGALEAYLGGSAGFYAQYLAFVQGGGDPNLFAQLPGLNLDGFAAALNAYALFIQGGGLPSGYSGADLEDLATYIAILQNSGRLAELLGANASILSAYFSHLAGGGSADGFSGLPLYSGYVSALNAYHAFLAGGGLPDEYTTITQEQIQAYLAALQAAGGFGAYSSLNSFFAAYYAHIAGGGSASTFAALPAYQNYLAALQAYYAYLAAGGLPSGYTALTQAQIQAYLALLARYGVLQASVSDKIYQFLTDYLAFIEAGGNDPDDFAPLPVNDPTVSLAAGARIWIFSNQGGRIGSAPTADVTPDGQITRTDYNTGSGTVAFDYTGAGNALREHGRVGNAVAWTRYEHGAAFGVSNANSHLLLGSPAIDLPASGLVEYRLIGGTAPTDSLAPAGQVGAFSGNLSVAFGSTPRVGLDFEVHLAARGWRAGTPGGAAGAATGGLLVDGSMGFASQNLQASGIVGDACTGYCNVSVFGGLFGSGAGSAGFQYFIDDQSGGQANRNYVNGVAVFGTSGEELSVIGTMPPAPPSGPTVYGIDEPADFPAGPATLSYVGVWQSPISGVQGYLGSVLTGTPTLDAEGLSQWTTTPTINRGTAQTFDTFGNERLLIGRWSEGAYSDFNLAANQGFHYLLAAPIAGPLQLPSGTASYNLLARTSPTSGRDYNELGVFDATLAIAFGVNPKIGVEGTIAMPAGSQAGYTYTFATSNGVANPSTNFAVQNGGTFQFSASGSTDNGRAGSITFRGALADNFAGMLGTVYFAQLYNNNGSGVFYDTIGGAAIFGRSDLYPDALASSSAGASGNPNPYASYATTAVPAAEVGIAGTGDWARFADSSDLPVTAARADLPPAELDGTGAEKLLGGMITFGGAGAP